MTGRLLLVFRTWDEEIFAVDVMHYERLHGATEFYIGTSAGLREYTIKDDGTVLGPIGGNNAQLVVI